MSTNFQFTIGGTVAPTEQTYLERQADHDLLAACKTHDYAYVLTTRQVGKSSLMIATVKKLQKYQIAAATIDLSKIGQANAEQWYFTILDGLLNELKLSFDIDSWWERQGPRSLTIRFERFLEEVVLQHINQPLVIFIDEIDTLLGQPFTNDFFAAIRSMYNNRAAKSIYKRLSFVLLGVATPNELIADDARTPYNIGKRITLEDFSMVECQPLINALTSRHPKQEEDYFEQIYGWTQGHPYLTQRLSSLVYESEQPTPDLVGQLVERKFLRLNPIDDNLDFVQSRVLKDPLAQPMLREYDQLLQQQSLSDVDSSAISRLKLYGLVISRQGTLQIRNRIYQTVFNHDWVFDQLQGEHKQIVALQTTIAEKEAELKRLQAIINDFEESQLDNKKLQQELEAWPRLYKIGLPLAIVIALVMGWLWQNFV